MYHKLINKKYVLNILKYKFYYRKNIELEKSKQKQYEH